MTIKEPVVPSAPMESERDIHVQNEESNNTNVMDYGVSSGVPIAQAVAIDAPEPYVPHASNSMNNNNNNNQATVIDSSNVQQSPMVVAATAVPQAATSTTTTTSYTVPPPNNAVTPQAAPPRPSGTTYVPGLSMKSARVTCPYCREQAVTNTKSQIDCCTIIGVIVMILVFWPLFWIPFICPCCKTTEHYCSRCHRKIGQAAPCNC